MSKRVLILNGSLRGASGNTGALLSRACAALGPDIVCDELVLAEYSGSIDELADRLRAANGFMIGTGVYWSSWGSPLQRFFEVMTSYELTNCFLGKPAAVLVTMDSVGGADVAERLLFVLSMLGCFIPPLSSLIISRVGALASARDSERDVWQIDDVGVLAENLIRAMDLGGSWVTWPIERTPELKGPYPAAGILDAGMPRFLTNLAGDLRKS